DTRHLHWSRRNRHILEGIELAAIGKRFVLPDPLHDLEAFGHEMAAPMVRQSNRFVFVRTVAKARPEDDAAAGQDIEGGHLFGHLQGVREWKEEDASAQPDSLGPGCNRR